MRKILTALFAIAFFSVSAQALAGQTVEINSNIKKNAVFGNSTVTSLDHGVGNSYDMDPNGNTVNTNGYDVGGIIYGGRANDLDDDANGNTVNVIGGKGTFGSAIYGGYAAKEGEAAGNVVNISGGTFKGGIYGGRSSQTATGNYVKILGGTFNGKIYGGYSVSGITVGNSVNISGGICSDDIYGGYSDESKANGEATDNSVNISGGICSNDIYGGYSESGEASGNSANISDGIFKNDIYGAYALQATARNEVNIVGGSFDGRIYGGYSEKCEAVGNAVNISGGIFKNDIYGAYALQAAVRNEVNISGGSFDGKIYGGYSVNGETDGNTVNISGFPDLGKAGLFGGFGETKSESSANNTLNLYSRTMVKEMGYFQNLNFYLPAGYGGDGTMLTVTGDADIAGAIVGVGINGASSPLRAGDTVILMDAGQLIGAPGNDGGKAVGVQGVTLQYEFLLDLKNNALLATVTADDPRDTGDHDDIADPDDPRDIVDIVDVGDSGGTGGVTVTNLAKALPEGLSANVTAINGGGDLISGAGAMKTPRHSSSESGSYTFGTTSFGKSRYNTGSHVDSDTLAVLAGIQLAEIRLGRAALSRGIFVEAGWNSYGTFNDFADAPDVRGHGESNYFGGGLALRADYGGNDRGWFYNDAAIRAGRALNSFACDGVMSASYKTDSPYYGGHIGLGYVRKLKNGAKLDIGARLLWTRLEGDSVTLHTKDPITFARSDSLRARVGARYDAERFYAGLAYEHEFDGDANATAYGFPIPAPSLKGGTGICELGFTLGKKNAPFSADVNISAFTGKREGFAAGINLNWKF
jgi:hypothetical protein